MLKFKPPLTTPQADFERMLDIAEETIAFIQSEVERQRTSATEHAIAGN